MPLGIVQLGRYGDILNILPLAHQLSATERPTIVVSEHFRDIAESISYADVQPFAGEFYEYRRALRSLRGFSRIITPQVYGDGIHVTPVTESFCLDAYARAGYLDNFLRGDYDRIVIDRRNFADEEALAKTTLPQNGLPNILVSLSSGYSSPFNLGIVFQHRAEQIFQGRANVIDLSKVRAKRFTDLLGLYDRSRMLITSDTGTMHLAGAHEIPYIAFVTDYPNVWYGGYTRGNCLARFRYSQAPMWGMVFDQICHNSVTGLAGRKFIHLYSDYKSGDQHTVRRQRIARQTWMMSSALGCWEDFPIRDNQLNRLFEESPGVKLPYIKDLLDAVAYSSQDNAVMVLTNTDTCFSSEMTNLLNYRQLVVGRRRDFPQLSDPLPVAEIKSGQSYCGADLFAMPVEWWKIHRDEMPDMVVGREAWDAVLAQLMFRHGAEETWDFIYHERHPSHWEDSQNRHSLPGQIHNLRLAYPKLSEWGFDPTTQFGVRKV